MTTRATYQHRCDQKLFSAIEFAYFSDKPFFTHKEAGQVNKSLLGNAGLLLKNYDLYAKKIASEHESCLDYNRKYRQSFATKKCFCGSTLKYIDGFNFWGCSNYKSPVPHSKFTGIDPEFYDKKVRIPTTWLVDIIKDSNLKGVVKAKEFYLFLIEQGKEDLRIKYGLTSSDNHFNQYLIAKERSDEQEIHAEEHIASLFDKYVYQQCIVYKLMGHAQTFCIPDFIAGDENHVLVADAKLHAMYIDDEKMDLYTALVEYIIAKKNDHRYVAGCHMLYRDGFNPNYSKSRYSIILI